MCLLFFAFEVGLVELVVAAVAVAVAFRVHFVTLLVARFSRHTPEEFALVRAGAAETLEAICLEEKKETVVTGARSS